MREQMQIIWTLQLFCPKWKHQIEENLKKRHKKNLRQHKVPPLSIGLDESLPYLKVWMIPSLISRSG